PCNSIRDLNPFCCNRHNRVNFLIAVHCDNQFTDIVHECGVPHDIGHVKVAAGKQAFLRLQHFHEFLHDLLCTAVADSRLECHTAPGARCCLDNADAVVFEDFLDNPDILAD